MLGVDMVGLLGGEGVDWPGVDMLLLRMKRRQRRNLLEAEEHSRFEVVVEGVVGVDEEAKLRTQFLVQRTSLLCQLLPK